VPDLATAALIVGATASGAWHSVLSASMAVVTPTPSPSPEFDESVVTPGPVGFIVVFGIAVITVLLILDMVRRVRRVRLRQELEAEELLARAAAGDASRNSPNP
jgi:sugar (pentulose or hexulose) kinase